MASQHKKSSSFGEDFLCKGVDSEELMLPTSRLRNLPKFLRMVEEKPGDIRIVLHVRHLFFRQFRSLFILLLSLSMIHGNGARLALPPPLLTK